MPRVVVTAEVKAQIIALAKNGTAPRDIRRQLNCDVQESYISVIVSQARKTDPDIPYATRRRSASAPAFEKIILRFGISPKAERALAAASFKRNTTASQLAASIIEAVCKDKIIDAVLDDGIGEVAFQ